MMNAIDQIYSNEIGISFYWKELKATSLPKVQLVFRDMGFLLTLNELKDFMTACCITKASDCYRQCPYQHSCRSLLLRTPSEKIDIAVSKDELEEIYELIKGTVFKIELAQWSQFSGLN